MCFVLPAEEITTEASILQVEQSDAHLLLSSDASILPLPHLHEVGTKLRLIKVHQESNHNILALALILPITAVLFSSISFDKIEGLLQPQIPQVLHLCIDSLGHVPLIPVLILHCEEAGSEVHGSLHELCLLKEISHSLSHILSHLPFLQCSFYGSGFESLLQFLSSHASVSLF